MAATFARFTQLLTIEFPYRRRSMGPMRLYEFLSISGLASKIGMSQPSLQTWRQLSRVLHGFWWSNFPTEGVAWGPCVYMNSTHHVFFWIISLHHPKFHRLVSEKSRFKNVFACFQKVHCYSVVYNILYINPAGSNSAAIPAGVNRLPLTSGVGSSGKISLRQFQQDLIAIKVYWGLYFNRLNYSKFNYSKFKISKFKYLKFHYASFNKIHLI